MIFCPPIGRWQHFHILCTFVLSSLWFDIWLDWYEGREAQGCQLTRLAFYRSGLLSCDSVPVHNKALRRLKTKPLCWKVELCMVGKEKTGRYHRTAYQILIFATTFQPFIWFHAVFTDDLRTRNSFCSDQENQKRKNYPKTFCIPLQHG